MRVTNKDIITGAKCAIGAMKVCVDQIDDNSIPRERNNTDLFVEDGTWAGQPVSSDTRPLRYPVRSRRTVEWRHPPRMCANQ